MISKILSQLSTEVHQEFNFDRPGGSYETSHYCLIGLLVLIAFYLRILNLGVPGLSGDEDIMGLAVRGLHENGQSVMPSGMEYRRAILHTYILYYSTLLFGQTEWALRIPSVLAGMLLLVYAFRIGRRFLDPLTNVATFSLFALASPLIEISRTARMYVFLVLLIAIFIHYIFKWEDEANYINPVLALFFLCIATTFHSLAIFALPVFFWPAFSTGSARRLKVAMAACIPFLVFYWYFGNWAGAPYPSLEERPLYIEAADPSLKYIKTSSLDGLRWALSAFALVGSVLMARTHVAILKNLRAAMLASGFALVMFRYYLPGAYVILVGALWRRRIDEIVDRPLVFVGCITLLIVSIDLVNSIAEAGMNRVALRLTFEQASPYFWIRAIESFPIPAIVLVTMTPLLGMKWKKPADPPGFVLLAIFSLLLPMFAMSTFSWDFEKRYLLVFVPLTFLMTGAIARAVISNYLSNISRQHAKGCVVTVALVGIATMQPEELYQYIIGATENLPAHKQTASFVESKRDYQDATIIAEDSIATHYYLGRVDYRLQYGPQAAAHVRVKDEKIQDQYTGAEIIGSGAELRRVLCGSRKPVYIIGEGQVTPLLRARNRGGGIEAVLKWQAVKLVFVTLPGPATVWRFDGVCEKNRTELDMP